MLSNNPYDGSFHELVVMDQGRIRRWGMDYFDTVLDFGANIGVFSILMRMLHPNAKIIAIEPSLRSIKYLEKNIDYMNITTDTRALGDGSTMYLQCNDAEDHPGGDWFGSGKSKNSQPIQTIPFWQFFLDHKCLLDEKLCVKIDIEGAEKFLIGDSKSEEILTHADYIFLEVHTKAGILGDYRNDNLATWVDFYKWIYKVFPRTHSIWGMRTKRRKGYGYYIMNKYR